MYGCLDVWLGLSPGLGLSLGLGLDVWIWVRVWVWVWAWAQDPENHIRASLPAATANPHVYSVFVCILYFVAGCNSPANTTGCNSQPSHGHRL